MTGVLVFDAEPSAVAEGESERTSIVLDETQDVLVFDAVSTPQVAEGGSEFDFVIFDAETRATETVTSPPDFLLVEAPKDPARVVLDGRLDEDLLVITGGGPPGPPGGSGPAGPAGPPGPTGDVVDPDLVDLTLLFENGLI